MSTLSIAQIVGPDGPAAYEASLPIRTRYERRIGSMIAIRKPYEPDWDEIAKLTLPSRRAALSASTILKRRANTSSQDTGGRRAGRMITNGMATGLSSSSRPWFELATPDPDLMEFQPVKEWLDHTERQVYNLFATTNYYDANKIIYSELSHFGSGAKVALEHNTYGAVFHALTVGEYWIELDDGLRVNALVRKISYTVQQMVQSFPWNRLSETIKTAYARGNLQFLVPIWHVIEYNRDRDASKFDVPNKLYRSIWWEEGQRDKNILLKIGGYDSKPFSAPRWETVGSQVYSDSAPGWDALPDLRELQLAARRKGRAMDMLVKPPMKAPVGLMQTGLNFDPGSVNYVDSVSAESLGPLWRPDWNVLPAIREDKEAIERRIEELFYADLFMAITEMEGVQPRNEQELLYRNEEKLTQLGPVVDRVNIEMLEVDIDRAVTILDNQNRLMPMPKELQGHGLLVNFVSILAQAQKAAQNTGIERAARFVGFVAGLFPDAAIKFDAEQAIDEFAANSGTSPKIIRSDEIVARMKEQMEQQKQAEQMAAMAQPAQQGAQAAELLSRTQIGSDTTMLQQLMGR